MKQIIFILLISCSLTFADSIDNNQNSFNKKWFTFGLGISDEIDRGSSAQPSYNMSMNFASKRNTIEIKYTYIYTSGLFSGETSQFYDFALLYGFKPDFKLSNLSFSAGVSIVGGYYLGYVTDTLNEEKKNIFTIGFPFELQLDWNAFTTFGIGINIFGDINFETSFYGAGLNFNIGSLR